jgi:asparagine synthase (glutamine-hydrolysing)
MHSNIDHREVIVSGRSPIAGLDRMLGLYDRPLYALCNHTWLSEIKSQARADGLTVMLTGEMGNFTVSSAPYTVLAD